MKKIMIMAACVMLAAVTQAASVGWNLATGSTTYAGDAYQFFVLGQNGAESIATVTTLLNAGTSTDSYAFGSGTVGANGVAGVAATASGVSLGAGTYEGFFVLFDAATPTSGSSKYAVISGVSTLTKEIGANTATTVFTTGNVSSTLSNASNWSSYGTSTPEPEPTSALMMLFGLAGLALRRKRA